MCNVWSDGVVVVASLCRRVDVRHDPRPGDPARRGKSDDKPTGIPQNRATNAHADRRAERDLDAALPGARLEVDRVNATRSAAWAG